MQDVTAEHLQEALAVRDKEKFNTLIARCSDFNLVVEFTIKSAKQSLETSFFEKNTLENMMELGLKRMMVLHSNHWNSVLAGHGRDPRQLIVCATVIEGYVLASNREQLLKLSTADGESLGYSLWKCCPNIMDSLRFPKIDKFISENISLYISNSLQDLVSNKYHFFFDILSRGIRKKLIPKDFVLNKYGEYTNTLFHYWCKVRSDARQKAMMILSRRHIPNLENREIRKLIARQIIHEVHMKTCALMDSANISTSVKERRSFLEGLLHLCTIRNGKDNAELVRVLLDVCPYANPSNSRLLHRAAYVGNMGVLRLLLEKGCDINPQDINGRTPLYNAVHYERTDVVRVLLENGANPNLAASHGATPLMQSVQNFLMANATPPISIVRLLVENGANVNQADNEGRTPLSTAVFAEKIDVVQLLLQSGAKITQAIKDEAKDNPEILALLEKTESDRAQAKKAATVVIGLGSHRQSLFSPLPQALTRQIAKMIVNPALTMKAV